MKYLLLIPFFTFGQNPKWINQLGQSSEKDDAKHYWVSALGTIGASSIIYHYTNKPGLSCLLGGAFMFGVGVGKEYIWDGMMKRGVKSGGDIFMDSMGVLGGMMGARVRIDIIYGPAKKQIKYYYFNNLGVPTYN